MIAPRRLSFSLRTLFVVVPVTMLFILVPMLPALRTLFDPNRQPPGTPSAPIAEPENMPPKKWPPPGFPLVEGNYNLTELWTIQLPEKFARRIEDNSLVLWRPGLTIWMAAWGNDFRQSQEERLARIQEDASPGRSAEQITAADGLTRYSYRLRDRNDDGPVESLNAVVIADDGIVQLSIYFDDLVDEPNARQLVANVATRKPGGAGDEDSPAAQAGR